MRVILGSSSPRRKGLLGTVIEDFEVIVPMADEVPLPGEDPEEFARRASREKMDSICAMHRGKANPQLIITSDTIVSIDGLILGKPANRDDAVQKIRLLNGRTHRVITGMTLHYLDSKKPMENRIATGCETTGVTFRRLSDGEIGEYLSKIDYMDKAGAYAAQEFGELIIEKTRGSITNVIGFPLRLFFTLVMELGLENRLF